MNNLKLLIVGVLCIVAMNAKNNKTRNMMLGGTVLLAFLMFQTDGFYVCPSGGACKGGGINCDWAPPHNLTVGPDGVDGLPTGHGNVCAAGLRAQEQCQPTPKGDFIDAWRHDCDMANTFVYGNTGDAGATTISPLSGGDTGNPAGTIINIPTPAAKRIQSSGYMASSGLGVAYGGVYDREINPPAGTEAGDLVLPDTQRYGPMGSQTIVATCSTDASREHTKVAELKWKYGAGDTPPRQPDQRTVGLANRVFIGGTADNYHLSPDRCRADIQSLDERKSKCMDINDVFTCEEREMTAEELSQHADEVAVAAAAAAAATERDRREALCTAKNCLNGTCSVSESNPNQAVCECPADWHGENCDISKPCGFHPTTGALRTEALAGECDGSYTGGPSEEECKGLFTEQIRFHPNPNIKVPKRNICRWDDNWINTCEKEGPPGVLCPITPSHPAP